MKTEKVDYEPSQLEILGAMYRDGKKFVSTAHQASKKFVVNTSLISIEVGLMPYTIPSFSTSSRGLPIKEPAELSDNEMLFGAFAGVISWVGSAIGIGYAGYHNHPEVLGIPVATNIASGLYEWYAHSKNKLVEECKGQIASENAKSLDTIVGNQTQKQIC